MTPRPLFGSEPVKSSLNAVQTVCVTKYPESATRPAIWEGFNIAHEKVMEVNPPSELWVSGDFVIDLEDPDLAQVLLLAKQCERTDELDDLLTFMNDESATDQLACDLAGFLDVPQDNPHYRKFLETRLFFQDVFSSHGPDNKKGFPILEFYGQP